MHIMYYYIHEDQIINNTFMVADFVLDKELTLLDTLRFVDLYKICKEVKVRARRRHTKGCMISEIKRYITFEPSPPASQ